jgi:peptide/nickel transport system substrate-binding protein
MVDPGYFTKLTRDASGTGPYQLQDWTPGQSITLVPNKRWWGGNKAPYLDKVVLSIYGDQSAAIAALQSGAVDMVQDVDPQRARGLTSQGFQTVQGAPGSLTLELRLSPQMAPFDNQAYRRAMNYAFDRAAIVKTIRAGYGQPAVTPWLTHDTSVEKKLVAAYPINLKRVEAAIKTSGVSNPDFTIMLQALPDTIQVAQIIQAAMKTIGVKVDLQTLDGATYVPRLVAGDFQATIGYGSGGQHYPSQVTFGSAWRTSNNALWKNNVPKNYLKAIELDQGALTKAKQAKALAQLRNAALVMSSVLVIADRPTLFALSKKVHGFGITVDSMPLFGTVWLSS